MLSTRDELQKKMHKQVESSRRQNNIPNKAKESQTAYTNNQKINFKTKIISRDKGVFYNDKKAIQQKDITITNIDAPNERVPK